MKYPIKEIFHSIQGEGYHTGKPLTFIRFSGCNLTCDFCDTDHSNGIPLTWIEVENELKNYDVCITGGEPLTVLGLDLFIIQMIKTGSYVHLETNGTLYIPEIELCWTTVSPKNSEVHPLTARAADEFKFLVGEELPNWRQIIIDSLNLVELPVKKYVMPIAGPNYSENVKLAYDYVMDHSNFYLTCQQHKLLGYQ